MGSGDEVNLHAKRKRMIFKLVKGRKFATQLQTLLQNPIEEQHGNNTVSVEELALQIYRSFTETLDEIQSASSDGVDEPDGTDAVDCGGDGCSGETKRIKSGRGCYKRRKTSDSRTIMAHTSEDCYGWRKYGQKKIMNSKYHRCYYRCTHKYEGCKALKQVQKIKENPLTYQITYLHRHTCKKNIAVSPLIMDSEPADPKLISFQSNNHNNNNFIKISAPVKQESKQLHNTNLLFLQEGHTNPSDDAKSTADIPWEDIVGSDDQVASCFDEYSSGSTSLNGLDMEVDQLGNIESLCYFDDM